MVEVRHICLFFELVYEISIDGHWLAYLRNAILYVDILDMEHAQTLNRRVLDELERLEERVEEELNLFLFERYGVCLEFVDIVE